MEKIREKEKRTKVDPRVARTRKLLFDAFRSLLDEKGCEEMTVQDIAERAAINRATFYAHFADKYDLGDTLMRDSFTETMERRLPGNTETPRDYVRALFLAVTEHWTQRHGQCRGHDNRMFESLVEAQIKGLLFDHIRSWMEERHAGSRQDREMIATIVSASIYGAAMLWTGLRLTEPAERYAEKVIPVIVASLQART